MADFPKYFAKGDKTKTAHSARQAVELRFAGYRETDAPSDEAAPAPDVTGSDTAVPELSEAEMAKQPEAKDAEVVDTTEKPTEGELKANADAKAADPEAYLAAQNTKTKGRAATPHA